MKKSELASLESEITEEVEKEAKYYEQVALNLGKKFRIFFDYPYVKLVLLVLSMILSYALFSSPSSNNFISKLGNLSYFGTFIAGLLFSFGFTTPFAIGFFLTANPSNIFLAAIIGGAGALISDLLIFKIIRVSFMDDFRRLENLKAFSYIRNKIGSNIPTKIKTYLLYIITGIIIASPLPDEVGVTMLAGMTAIDPKTLGIMSFICNSLGILVVLFLGSI